MERFKQLQQENGKGDKVEQSRLDPTLSVSSQPKAVISHNGSHSKANSSGKVNKTPSSLHSA